MSFLNALFGRGKKEVTNNKPDISALLASPDVNGSIIELDNYIAELGAYGDELENLTLAQKFFFFNQNLEREVNNGGFNLFFINSSGEFAHETVQSLQAIGANKTSDIVQQAIAQFPSKKVPKDRDERQALVQKIEAETNDIWDELTQKFFRYEDNLNALNLKYVKENRHSF